MNRKEKAKKIQAILGEHFPDPAIPLQHSDSYTLLIAVLLSAQCTDARVNTVTPVLFARADTPHKMAELPIEEIETIIRSCGLAPTKARNISALSHMLAEQGAVPDTLEELEKLPGVGHKTASVLMIQAFGKPAFPVDTHIHRCAHRWGLSQGKSVEKTEADLKKLFPKSSWAKLHLQIILFAREYCPARSHDPSACPMCSMLS